ncbi:MAG: bifunctional [glutamine synthetase] adenylyltransferase/[glutamine synthetase]-adenylyl-L-tyrosine phosphorylase [Acidimicrobiales bacterium]
MGDATAAGPWLAAAVQHSAAPAAVRAALDRLAAAHPGLHERLEEEQGLGEAVVAVAAASRPLLLTLETDPEALEQLSELDRPGVAEPPDGSEPGSLGRWYRRALVRLAARDLLGIDDLPVVAAGIADLASQALAASVAAAGSGAGELVVVGMGKLGGRELNYASDVDLMFVAPDGMAPSVADRAARAVVATAGQCFRVDVDLRPEGRDGALTRTVGSYRAYWDRWAEPWEFQALLKAVPVAGPDDLASSWLEAASARLWERPLPADELRSLRAMKARTEAEVVRKGLAGRELKRGSGGIRDIEFAVQLLQLVHGRSDPHLRRRGTLDALAELGDAGYVAPDDAAELRGCYCFLRTVEHRLQLAHGQQTHTVPSDAAERELLARSVGHRSDATATALERFDTELSRCRSTVRTIHERLYFRPLLEAFACEPGGLAPDVAADRLAAFGFGDPDRTRQAVRELTKGLTRSSRLMDQLLPILLGWLADSPDPDRGLLGLRILASGTSRSAQLVQTFRESPLAAARLCTILGTSPLLLDQLQHNPDLIPLLADDDALDPDPSEHRAAAGPMAVLRAEPERRNASLRRAKDRELAKIAMRDLVGIAGVDATAADLTELARTTITTALDVLEPQLPFAVVALGRLGGGELSYASDLDVVFVHGGTTAADATLADDLATSLLRLLRGSGPASRLYDVDLGLRPEGRAGALARSVDGFASYFERWAQVWERQAMVRARPIAGDADLCARFSEITEHFVWEQAFTSADAREVRRVKARVERERLPAGDDPEFHLKLGRGSLTDVEFCAQLLQLQHGVRAAGTMEALARLDQAGVLDPADTATLAGAYRTCEQLRNRLFLVLGTGADAIPRSPEDLRRLARSLDTSPVELRERYRRDTRRARAVVERVFYGRG